MQLLKPTVNGDKLFSCGGSGLPAGERMACWKGGTALLLVVLLVLLDLQPSNTGYPWAWPRIGPALERAIKTVNADPTLLPNHHLTYVFKNSEDERHICSESIAPLMAVDLKLAYDPWAFIGQPGCSYPSSPVGLFTTHWDVPMVTAGAPAVAFDGGVYPSITNTGPTHKKLGKFALRVCEHFGWRKHVMLMFNDNKVDDRACYFAVEGLYTELKSINITLVDSVFEEKSPISYSQILTDIQHHGRVIFVCCSPDVFRKLMVEFRQADLPHEQYVFFYIDVFGDSLNAAHRQPWARGDEDDVIAKEAFQLHVERRLAEETIFLNVFLHGITKIKPSDREGTEKCLASVKILTYREPQNHEYKEFVNNLKTDAREMFNYTIEDSLMNIIAGGFYDGLMLYTHALNETMSWTNESSPRPPGKVVTKRMWNRTFHEVQFDIKQSQLSS
ncbi:hypothetical protein L3Q82_002273 [Scortum barcoo]|uniref:Uncharacterized protein n=1 Tax=Scortum barcoo TaxID=214431 RepID=A0ACB8VXU4_9TELE|nr:hypothetical protein L3Q82_002273 [Scortum barcoo]